MKISNIKFFLVFLLSSDVITPVEWTSQKTTALAITSCFAISNLYQYLQYYGEQPEEFYVKSSFPYAQLWYEDMIIKYPAAHLDKKRFLQARHGVSKEETVWSAMCNNIYCPQGDLIYLESLYKKKIDGEQLTDQEITSLDTYEYLLLHESGHIELDYSFNDLVLTVGMIAALEGIKAMYKESTDDACAKSTEAIFHGYFSDSAAKYLTDATMWTRYIAMTYFELAIVGSIKLMWVRDQEVQADNFANKHVATDALSGAIAFFERVVNSYNVNGYQGITVEMLVEALEEDANIMSLLSYFNITAIEFSQQLLYVIIDPLHPTIDFRVQAIRDEIERRLADQAVAQ